MTDLSFLTKADLRSANWALSINHGDRSTAIITASNIVQRMSEQMKASIVPIIIVLVGC